MKNLIAALLISTASFSASADTLPDLHCKVRPTSEQSSFYGQLTYELNDLEKVGSQITKISIKNRGMRDQKVFYSNYRTGSVNMPFYNENGDEVGIISTVTEPGLDWINLYFHSGRNLSFAFCHRFSNQY